MYKTRHAFTILLLKESVANDIINVSLDQYAVNHAIVVCWPVSMLKAEILSITYDCCSQNNNVSVLLLYLVK